MARANTRGRKQQNPAKWKIPDALPNHLKQQLANAAATGAPDVRACGWLQVQGNMRSRGAHVNNHDAEFVLVSTQEGLNATFYLCFTNSNYGVIVVTGPSIPVHAIIGYPQNGNRIYRVWNGPTQGFASMAWMVKKTLPKSEVGHYKNVGAGGMGDAPVGGAAVGMAGAMNP